MKQRPSSSISKRGTAKPVTVSSPPFSTIHSLPNEILVKILEQLHLQQQIRLRVVCTRWFWLVKDSFRRRRRSLKLFGSLDDLEEYCENVTLISSPNDLDYWKLRDSVNESDDLIIKTKRFDEKCCEALIGLFPQMHHLIVCISDNRLFAQLPRLLSHWSDGLVSLSLCGWFNPNTKQSESIYKKICTAIDSMSSLKRLDLLYDNFLYFYQLINDQFMNVFPRLTQLSFNCSVQENLLDNIWLTGRVFTRLSDQCTTLYLESMKYFSYESIPSTVTHLTLHNYLRSKFSRFVLNFEHLQYLSVELFDVRIESKLYLVSTV